MPGPYAGDGRCRDFVACLARMLGGYKWTGAELSRRCNYSPAVISNIMTFQRAPTVPQGEAFDKAFGVTDMFAGKARVIRGPVVPGLIQAVFVTLPDITAEGA